MATPILRAETLTPAPPQLTKGKAVDATNTALKNCYGKKFKKGKRKNVNCVKQEPRRFSCKVRWIYGNRSYEGKVIVSGSPSSPSTKIQVSSKRHG